MRYLVVLCVAMYLLLVIVGFLDRGCATVQGNDSKEFKDEVKDTGIIGDDGHGVDRNGSRDGDRQKAERN
jgi:hypothetical protein